MHMTDTPNDNTIRILIVDDTLTQHIELPASQLFTSDIHGVDARIVTTPKAGMEVLDGWLQEGNAADIVCADYNIHIPETDERFNGVSVLEDIKNMLPEDYQPKKMFLHSKSGLSSRPGTEEDETIQRLQAIGSEYFHAYEFFCMADHIKTRGQPSTSASETATNNFRQYVNGILGSDFPTELWQPTEHQGLQNNDSQYLDICTAIAAYESQELSAPQTLSRVDLLQLQHELQPVFNNKNNIHADSLGVGGGPPLAGYLAFSAQDVSELNQQGKIPPVLVANTLENERYSLFSKVGGMMLLEGGSKHLPSYAANHNITYAAKDRLHVFEIKNDADGKPKLVRYDDRERTKERYALSMGDSVSLCSEVYNTAAGTTGTYGKFYPAYLEMTPSRLLERKELKTLLRLAKEMRDRPWHRQDNRDCHGVMVKANADGPDQVAKALEFEAEGVGLLRTERMFTGNEDNLHALQAVMLTGPESKRHEQALSTLERSQLTDYKEIFQTAISAAEPFPVTIRLFDASPEEMLPDPKNETSVSATATATKLKIEDVKAASTRLRSEDHRGVVFALEDPDIYRTQLKAIFEAARETGSGIVPEIMVPGVRTADELRQVRDMADETARQYGFMDGEERRYRFGSMIETPEAAGNAGSLAPLCDFVSFGLNDLSSAVSGIPRGDTARLEEWLNEEAGRSNPFTTLIPEVETMMQNAVNAIREVNNRVRIGVCGDQAGDAHTIEVCQRLDLDSVSVAPTREAIVFAKIAAGKAATIARLEAQKSKTQNPILDTPASKTKDGPYTEHTLRIHDGSEQGQSAQRC